MNPIVGTRYSLRGKNYDLCEAEFLKVNFTLLLMKADRTKFHVHTFQTFAVNLPFLSF